MLILYLFAFPAQCKCLIIISAFEFVVNTHIRYILILHGDSTILLYKLRLDNFPHFWIVLMIFMSHPSLLGNFLFL